MYSVIIPVFNHARYVGAAIESVLSQTVPASEIIVIDDGSSDDSASVVQQLASAHSNIIFWRQPNRGAHFTINTGLHRATTDVLAILNSDDLFTPRRMETCLQKLSADAMIDCVATEVECVNDAGLPVRNEWYENALAEGRTYSDMALALLNANYLVTTSNLVIRRSVFDRIGYFSKLRYAHDLEFMTRMLHRGARIDFLCQPLLKYRIHSSNTISENQRKVRVEWAAIIAWYMVQLSSSRRTTVAQQEAASRVLKILHTHNLGHLVQWFSWRCTQAASDGYTLFEHPQWDQIAATALMIDI